AVASSITGFLYVNQLEGRQQALAQPVFPVVGFLLVVLVPVLTMRTFADEARTGTLELLQAAGAPARSLVVGKWLAAWLTALTTVVPALVLVGLVTLWGNPDAGPVFTGVIGLALLAAAACGIGVFVSSLTSSQALAALVALFASLLLWFAAAAPGSTGAGGLLVRLSFSERLRGFAGGVIDSADAGFFVAIVIVTLALATVALGARPER
ncbi:MAG: gliding motility-associated transport system permease protein, partial [Actinomycetota bacterium]|nr:gliding motility-associated transport system permease protein [Actinomycetota bacterium]